MNIYDFLAKLRELEIKVHLEGDELKIEAPKGVVTSELIAQIKDKKQELIQAIRSITQRSKNNVIPKIEEQKTYLVSHTQKRFWISEMTEGNENTYVISGAFELQGKLAINKLQKSFNNLVERHEILRTVFEQNAEDKLYQKILPFQAEFYKIKIIDFSTEKKPKVTAETFINNQLKKQFQLQQLPLIRLGVCKLSETNWQLYFSMHHIISDGWSMSILINELTNGYQDENWFQNESNLDIQYKEYAHWQQQLLKSEKMQAHEAFWKEQFNNLPTPLQFPIQKVPPKYPSNVGRIHSEILPQTEIDAVILYAKTQKVSIFSVLLAATTTLMYRYTSQREFIIGTPVAGRNHAELKNQIGPYINLVPLKIEINPETSFSKNFTTINRNLQKAFSNQEYPYDLIVEAVKQENSQRTSLIDIMISFSEEFGNENTEVSFGEGINIIPIAHEHTTSRFDITCNFVKKEEVIYLNIEYRTELFEEALIKQFSQSFIDCLKVILINDTCEIHNLDYLTLIEKEVQITSQNTEKTILEIIHEQCKKTPKSTAISHHKEVLTYKELWNTSLRFANYLKTKKNIQKGDFVVLALEHSSEAIYGLLAILMLGAIYVPVAINTPEDRVQTILDDCNAKIMLTKEDIITFKEQSSAISNDFQIEKVTLEDTAYLIYTSGSSGIPKGVLLSQKNLCSHARIIQEEIIPHSTHIRMLHHASYAFDISLFEIFTPLISGGEMIITNGFDIFDPNLQQEILAKITHIEGVPSFFNQLIQSVSPEVRLTTFKNIEQVYIGGDAVSTQHLVNLEKWFQNTTINELYGPTETTIWCAKKTYAKKTTRKEAFKGSVIGQAVGGHELILLDEYLHKVPNWVAGEIHIGGEGVSKGYLQREELTTKHFIQHPFKQNELLYKTGDMAHRLPNGDIEFLERKDNQVKINGYRIELGEIEYVIHSIEDIQEVVLVIHDNEDTQKEIVAYFTANKIKETEEIRSYLQKKLPEFMVPNQIHQLESIILTPNGKVDKKALKNIQKEEERPYKAPTTLKEEVLVTIWQEVLRKKNIGINDNFYSLGGDSIKSIQIASRVKQHGYQIKIVDVLKNPIVAEQALLLNKVKNSIDQVTIVGNVPLTPIQHYFFENSSNINQLSQSVLLETNNSVEVNFFKQSIAKVVAHHDALRLQFHKDEKTWTAYNKDISEVDFDFELYDLTVEINAVDTLKTIAKEMQASFQIEEGKLLKVAHFKTKTKEYILLICHHLIIDGVSWRILIEDISTGYQQLKQHKKIALPLKTDAYQKWATSLVEKVTEGGFLSEINYWKNVCQQQVPVFSNITDTTNNPFDREVAFTLSKTQTLDLQTKVHKVYKTEINDILLTALGLAIKETFGIEKTMLKMESHGREDIIPNLDISRTIGWFTSIYPFVLDVSESSEVIENVISVKEALRKLPNKGIGYGILQYLSDDFQGKFTPSIIFNYLGDFGSENDEQKEEAFQLSGEKITAQETNDIEENILNISGMTISDQLSLSIEYTSTVFAEETITKMIQVFENNIVTIIETLSKTNENYITPSDLTFKGIPMSWLQEHNINNNIKDIYTLSPLQEGIYYHWLSSDDNSLYFEQMAYRLQGEINLDYIEKAYQQLIDRHAVLRTSFTNNVENELLQIVWKSVPKQFYVKEIDATKGTIDAQVTAIKLEDRANGFDLEKPSQMRLLVLVLGNNEYEFIWSHHHILSDGWCMSILLNDFNKLLQGLYTNEVVQLSKPVPYSKYIQWLSTVNKKTSFNYWKNYLKGYEKVIKIPSDRSPLKNRKQSIRTKRITLPKTVFTEVQRNCEELGITENSFMQTAWGYLLSKYNDTKDVVFGTIVSGRPEDIQDVENIIGLFINTIPVRIQYEENQTIQEVLQNTHKKAIEGTSHHYLSISDVQAQTPFGRQLINHLLVFENYPVQETVKANEDKERATVTAVEIFEQTNYDFTITITPTTNGLDIDLKYNEQLYDEVTIDNLSQHLVTIVEEFCIKKTEVITSVEYVPETEKEQLTHEFNNTAVDFKLEKTLIETFEKQVKTTPTATAIIEGSQRKTFKELNTVARKYATYLHHELGIKTNDRVVVSLPLGFDLIAIFFAVKKLGAVVVPVDIHTSQERITYIKENSNSVAFIQEETIVKLKNYTVNTTIPKRNNNTDNTEFILYTSGSTGNPKGVKLSRLGVMNRLHWMWNVYPFQSTEISCAKTSISFVDHIWEIYGPLLQGIPIVIFKKEEILDIVSWINYLHKEKVTRMVLVPSLLKEIMNHPNLCKEKLTHLQLWISSGEVLNKEVAQRFYEIFQDENKRLLNIYGSTEITADATYFDTSSMFRNTNEITIAAIENIPIGKPIANTNVYILDEYQKLVPVGVTGELYVGGAAVSQGYIHTAQTADRFILSAFNEKETLFKTGDFGKRLSDGTIIFLGRKDHQVKIRGQRAELTEIEHILLQYEGIESAVTIVKNDTVAAFYIASKKPDLNALRTHCKKYLPEYMIPVHYMQLDEIPLTINGKMDRKAIAEIEIVTEQIDENHVEAETDTEKKVVKIWEEVLDIESIGMDDNFFEIGGHSLHAIKILTLVNKQFNMSITMKKVLSLVTIKELAGYINFVLIQREMKSSKDELTEIEL